MKRVMVSDGKVYVTDDRWVTIGGEDEDGSGQHVLIKENGTIVAGFGKGKNVKNAFGGSEKSSGSKYEAKARESVEYWLKTHYKTESDKNIKESVESVRSQMEYRLKSAEKNLRDAKGTGKPELIKEFQDKYDEAKGMLDALNKYYDGGTIRKADTPEKANAVIKAKPKAEATYTDASAKFKNVAHRLDIDGSKSTDAYKYAQRLTKAAEKGGEDAVKNEIEKIKKTIDSTENKHLKGLRKEHLDYVLEKAYGKKLDTAAKRYKDLVDTGETYYAYSTNGRIGTLRDKIDRLSRQLKKASPEKAAGIKERLDKAKELRATLIKEREDAFSKIKNAPKLKNEEYYNKKVDRFEKLAKRREKETGNYFDPRAERLRDRAQRMRTLRYMSFIQKEDRE